MENWLTKSYARELDKGKSLPPEFYCRNTVQVAQDLLGKILIVRTFPEYEFDSPHAEVTAGRIVETEAYRENDPASHAYRGETPRSSIMFGQPGFAYVYLIYGMYEMLNFVTEPQGLAGAVLIRAVEPLFGEELMRKRRNRPTELTNGPGRLCQAMGIKRSHNGESLCGTSFYVVDDGFQYSRVSQSGRVGIRQGRERLWRFFATGHSCVSRAPQNALSKELPRLGG